MRGVKSWLLTESTQNSAAAELAGGWPWIENHLEKHDTGWVKVYADDIDSLLVFVSTYAVLMFFR